MATKIEVGDTVKARSAVDSPDTIHFRVDGLSDDGVYAWLRRIKPLGRNAGSNYHTGITTVYEKVLPFFEEGKTYERTLADSDGRPGIYIDTFEVARVEKNPNGNRVAFGRIYGSGYDSWVVRMERHYATQEWRLT